MSMESGLAQQRLPEDSGEHEDFAEDGHLVQQREVRKREGQQVGDGSPGDVSVHELVVEPAQLVGLDGFLR